MAEAMRCGMVGECVIDIESAELFYGAVRKPWLGQSGVPRWAVGRMNWPVEVGVGFEWQGATRTSAEETGGKEQTECKHGSEMEERFILQDLQTVYKIVPATTFVFKAHDSFSFVKYILHCDMNSIFIFIATFRLN